MVEKLLERINVFYLFFAPARISSRCIRTGVHSAVLFCFFEPRNDLGMQKLEVIETRWSRSMSTSGVGRPKFKAEVLLPNGNVHEFPTQPNFVYNANVCAAVQFGK